MKIKSVVKVFWAILASFILVSCSSTGVQPDKEKVIEGTWTFEDLGSVTMDSGIELIANRYLEVKGNEFKIYIWNLGMVKTI